MLCSSGWATSSIHSERIPRTVQAGDPETNYEMTVSHFLRAEFACPHCKESFVRPALIQLLELVRLQHRAPVRIVSGYRCPVHNHEVGGAHDSQHCYGAAADLELGVVRPETAIRLGFTGVGTKRGWATHVDIRDGRLSAWAYPD